MASIFHPRRMIWRDSLSRSLGGFLALIALAVSLGAATPASAVEGDDDIIILGEDDERTDGRGGGALARLLDYADRYAFGNIGGFYGLGTSAERSLFATRVGVDYPFNILDWLPRSGLNLQGRARVELGYGARRVEVTQEYTCEGACAGFTSDERKLVANTSQFELREAYGELELLSDLVLTVGRVRPIWGQFDIFSAVNLLLPIEFQSNEFGLGKQTYRMPQDIVLLSWFPLPRLELQGYYFIDANLDPLYLDFISGDDITTEFYVAPNDVNVAEGRFTNNAERYPSGLINVGGCEDVDHGFRECRAIRPDRDPEEETAFAFRALYYGSRATMGFTYYNGFSSFGLTTAPLLYRVCADNHACLDNNQVAYSLVESVTILDSEAFALEFSVPLGRWNWKAEVVYTEGFDDMGAVEGRVLSETVRPAQQAAIRRYYDWVISDNGSRAYIPTRSTWFVIGVDLDYDRWKGGVAVSWIHTETRGSASAYSEELRRQAGEAGEVEDQDEIDDDDVFPTMYLTYEAGADRKHLFGIAGGILGPIAGVTAFYNGTWRDDLDWTFSLEYLLSVDENILSGTNSEETREGLRRVEYDLKEEISFGGRMGLLWRF